MDLLNDYESISLFQFEKNKIWNFFFENYSNFMKKSILEQKIHN